MSPFGHPVVMGPFSGLFLGCFGVIFGRFWALCPRAGQNRPKMAPNAPNNSQMSQNHYFLCPNSHLDGPWVSSGPYCTIKRTLRFTVLPRVFHHLSLILVHCSCYLFSFLSLVSPVDPPFPCCL